MVDDTKVVIRDDQWLGNRILFADFGEEEVIVAFDGSGISHPRLADLPDNEQGQWCCQTKCTG